MADISEQILVALRRVTRAVDQYSRQLAQTYGLTGPQAVIMKALARDEGMTMGELARQVNLSQATVTDIAKRLEARGLLERRRSTHDRRRVGIRLTDNGRQLMTAPLPLLQEHFVAQLHQLHDWEQTQLLSSLQRIGEMMNAQDIDAAPLLASGALEATPEAVVQVTAPQGHGAAGDGAQEAGGAAGSSDAAVRRSG
jgi:DNA-binding MarR family transcriptional regulator